MSRNRRPDRLQMHDEVRQRSGDVDAEPRWNALRGRKCGADSCHSGGPGHRHVDGPLRRKGSLQHRERRGGGADREGTRLWRRWRPTAVIPAPASAAAKQRDAGQCQSKGSTT